MTKKLIVLTLSILVAYAVPVVLVAENAEPEESPAASDSQGSSTAVPAEPAKKSDTLFSPSVARRFYEMAYELAGENANPAQVDQALVFLRATRRLDSGADYATPMMLRLLCRNPHEDNSADVYRLLEGYVDSSADLGIAGNAITYMLDQFNSRAERERLLSRLYSDFAPKNKVLGSELATLLGALKLEKSDIANAKALFASAYSANNYNRIAFKKMLEIMPERIETPVYLRDLRLRLRENPMDIDAAMNFAQFAEDLQLYDISIRAYQYSALLFVYLYPSEPLPPNIYLPWAISAYNSTGNERLCLQIAKVIRKRGRFDLLLEAIAGKAAKQTGNAREAKQILKTAAQKAENLLDSPSQHKSGVLGPKQLAWFYCFALPESTKALEWANMAYSAEPNSPAAAAILAYALAENGKLEWAQSYIKNSPDNQIAALVRARISMEQGRKDQAITTLKEAVDRDPGSLAAEKARGMLADLGAMYVPAVDPDAVEAVMNANFDKTVPKFMKPEEIIGVQFNLRGNKFSYGSDFGGTIAVVNRSKEPLIISDRSLFRGNIRIDVRVSGDLRRTIRKLVSRRVRTSYIVEPGRSLLTPVKLATGELGELLRSHPQASLNLEFTLYLDPVTNAKGETVNRLVNVKPTVVAVKRPGVELTGKYLRSRFNSVSTGREGQKIRTAELFVGLLKEQNIMSGRRPLYRYRYADWMPELLKSALLHNSGLLRNTSTEGWITKVHTMAEMTILPLDSELRTAVSENLSSPRWPVRLAALYLLSDDPDGKFSKVLNWVAENDEDDAVRAMAVALGGSPVESTNASAAEVK